MLPIWFYSAIFMTPPAIYLLKLTFKTFQWIWRVQLIKRAVDKFTVGEKPHWLLGHTNVITGANEALLNTYLEWTAKADRGAFALNLAVCSQLVLCHPDTVKQVLKTSEPKGMIPATGAGYKLLTPWLGQGLLLSNGDKWARNRKLLSHGFHTDILKSYTNIMNDCVDKLARGLQNITVNSKGKSIEILGVVSPFTLNVIKKCEFSSKDNYTPNPDNSECCYMKTVKDISKLLMKRVLSPHLYIDQLYALTENGRVFFELCKFLHESADNIIKNRRQELQNIHNKDNRNKCLNLLDLMLLAKDENGEGLTDKELRDEVETFLFVGHNTTASAITWTLYNIASHSEVQQRVQTEIDSLYERKKLFDITWDDLNNISYLTQCVKESLRLHPPVPNIFRELTKPMVIDGDVVLPGTVVEINMYAVHHNPRVWGEDHMLYNPDRFLPENMNTIDSFAFIPFSAGPRRCIGQSFAMNEIKMAVMHILHTYNVTVDKSHKIELLPAGVLNSKDGVKLYFQNRNQHS